ncbi:MAG: hypothetical protein ACI4EK_07460 [Wujia sp.]
MRGLLGFAFLFIAIGMILSCFISGFFEFLFITILLIMAYILLCCNC